MANNVVLKLSDITMQFGGVVAVDNLNLEVRKNEVIGLIGPNGAGKTTAFNVVTGVYEPTNGAVDINGVRVIENFPHGKMAETYKGKHQGGYDQVMKLTPDKVTKLGVARTFQNIRLFKEMSVLENVLVAMHMNQMQRNCCARSSFTKTDTIRLHHCHTASSAIWKLQERWRRIRRSCCSMNRRQA